jgi:hypothetical protein
MNIYWYTLLECYPLLIHPTIPPVTLPSIFPTNLTANECRVYSLVEEQQAAIRAAAGSRLIFSLVLVKKRILTNMSHL